MPLITAEDWYGDSALADGVAARAVVNHWPADERLILPAKVGGPAAIAYVNHGRWVTECPYGCGSAQVVTPADPRFFCLGCRNRGSGRWSPVTFPAQRQVIEAALERRPPRNANWLPGEPVERLLKENADHGMEA